MNSKFIHIAFRLFVPGLIAIFLLTIPGKTAKGQANTSGYKDVTRQRLLIRITAHYIHTISQGQIDMDSAIRIPCKLYGLSPFLAYNEGYSDGRPSSGTKLLDAGKVKEARALLANLRGEARLRLLIELGDYFVFKPGTERTDIDQASKYVNEAVALSNTQSAKWKMEAMILRANLLQQSGLEDDSQQMFAQVIKLGERSGDRPATARALLTAARLLPYGHPSRLPGFKKALAIFQSNHAKAEEIETLSEMNVEYFVFKNYNVAERLTHRIIDLQTQIKHRHQQYAYDVLSFLSQTSGNFTGAVTYSNKSLESLISPADSVFVSLFYGRRAQLYENLGKKDLALNWYNKALEKKSGETRLYWYKAFLMKARMLNNNSREQDALSLLRETGRQYPPVTTFEKMYFSIALGQAYEQLKKFPLAEDQYKTFLKLAENFPEEYIHAEFAGAYGQISAFYRIIGETGKARGLLERAKPYYMKVGMMGKSSYYEFLSKIDSAEKQYLDAFKNLRLSIKYYDLAITEEQIKKADELSVIYEAEKKDRDIKLLNSQNQLERIRAADANRTKNITLAGLALMLIIIGLLFNSYRIKQRNNRQLEASKKELDQKNHFLETLNTEQEKLLKEKEWLIKEVHHRVKNNLQMVTSLLYSQSVYLNDDSAKLAVNDSLRRMQAMSLIHQKLYQDENTSTIAMPEYIDDLVRYLNESFDAGNRITFEQTVEDFDLDVSQAIPLGLIITESIVNAIKYAFLKDQRGIVSISLQHDGPDHLQVKISDNGIGLPEGFDTVDHNSLGLDLMNGLTKQLKGSFHIENHNGVHITVKFKILHK